MPPKALHFFACIFQDEMYFYLSVCMILLHNVLFILYFNKEQYIYLLLWMPGLILHVILIHKVKHTHVYIRF